MSEASEIGQASEYVQLRHVHYHASLDGRPRCCGRGECGPVVGEGVIYKQVAQYPGTPLAAPNHQGIALGVCVPAVRGRNTSVLADRDQTGSAYLVLPHVVVEGVQAAEQVEVPVDQMHRGTDTCKRVHPFECQTRKSRGRQVQKYQIVQITIGGP